MLDKLKEIENNLIIELLNQPLLWKTKFIDYETPFVERVYTEINELRLSLHYIHPCEKSFIHPHVWPSAMHVIDGIYEMGLYYPNEFNELSCVSTLISNGDLYYEMLDRKSQHHVKPINNICKSVMLTDKPIWVENDIKLSYKLNNLNETRKIEIIESFKDYYNKYLVNNNI